MANEIAKKNDYGTQVIKRVEGLCSNGFSVPADYNYVNAIKASQLILSELTDKSSGKSVLEVCTPASIQTALFKMVTKGLDVSKGQAYFIKRGSKLTLQDSYFGNILQVKRIFPSFDPKPRVIYEGDDFEYYTNPHTGKRVLAKHEQKLENIDGDFRGAYMYIPCADGQSDLYIMTKKQIMTAWDKSTDKNQSVHKAFKEKMICKTLVNSACSMIINSTPECSYLNTQTEADPDEHSENFYNAEEEPSQIEDLTEAVFVDADEIPAGTTEELTDSPETDF